MGVNQLQQLVVHRLRLFLAAAAQGFGGAVMQVISHQIAGHAAQGLLNAGRFRDDVGAIAIVFHHFLQAADLSFDAAQAMAIGLFDVRIDSHGFARVRITGTVGTGAGLLASWG